MTKPADSLTTSVPRRSGQSTSWIVYVKRDDPSTTLHVTDIFGPSRSKSTKPASRAVVLLLLFQQAAGNEPVNEGQIILIWPTTPAVAILADRHAQSRLLMTLSHN